MTFRRFISLLVVVALIGGGIWLTDFFANMPRERAQLRYNYWERVAYGAQMSWRMLSLWLRAEPDPVESTKLPIVELRVPKDSLRALKANLPESGTKPQPAEVKLNDEWVPAEARFNGISVNHWGMFHKSWQVTPKEGLLLGFPRVNLVIPRADTQFENWLGYKMADMWGGVLTPACEFVHFRLNGKFDGIRTLTEPMGPKLVERRGLPIGKVFFGDITTQQIYNNVPREKLFSQKEGWEVVSPWPEDKSIEEITRVIDLVQKESNPYRFYYRLHELMEVPALLRYMALLEIVSSVHIDETHNWKLYLNPQSQKFSPIVFNTVAYYWRNTKRMDLAPNDLFRVVLSNPGLREEKDRLLWQAISGALSELELKRVVSQEVERIRPDMYASPWKMHAGDRGITFVSNEEWEQSIRELFGIIDERHAYLRRELEEARLEYRLTTSEKGRAILALQVSSRAGVAVKSVRVAVSGARGPIAVRRQGLEDLGVPLKNTALKVPVKNGEIEIQLGDILSSKRRVPRRGSPQIVPSIYIYELQSEDSNGAFERVLEVDALNTVTGGIATVAEDPAIEIRPSHTPNIVWWAPEQFQKEVK